MNPAGEDKVLRRLASGSAALRRNARTGGWGVYPGGDQRRRPLASVTEATVRELRASGAIEATGEALVLTEAGRKRLERIKAERQRHGAQHRDEAGETRPDERGVRRSVRVNRRESPLARFREADPATGRAFLESAEFEAGERLRGDLDRSTLNPRLTMDWSAPPAGKQPRGPARDPAGASDSALAARERVLSALSAVGGPLDSILLDCLWRERGFDEMERAGGWPRRSAKLALKLALQRLALHYGMLSHASRS